jgi:hypothetical protein
MSFKRNVTVVEEDLDILDVEFVPIVRDPQLEEHVRQIVSDRPRFNRPRSSPEPAGHEPYGLD